MKATRLIALAALFVPAALAAQQPVAQTPPPGGPLTAMFRGATMGRQRNIAQAFDSIPESKFSYKPTPASQTIGFIAQHLANDNSLYCGAFGVMKPTRSAKETETADSVKATWPKDTLVAQLKASFKFCEDAFAQLADSTLTQMADVTFGGQVRQVVRAQMVLGHVTDMTDHYSQLANYMRLNGILPPTALPRPAGRGRGGE
jgi:uncharacterized damage-inducible protein DinB